MSLAAESLVACGDHLGEGACYDAERGRLWWLDVPTPSRLHALDVASGETTRWNMPQMITAARPCADDGALIVACHSGLARFDLKSATLTPLLDPEPDKPFNRSNDAGTDPKGRFWFGTMQNNIAPDGAPIAMVGRSGALYRLDADMRLTRFAADVGISNTLCWSPDGRTMYFADTLDRVIFAYDYDVDDGVPSNRRPFATFDRGDPDGSTVDADGCLWNARWDGHCVARFTPRGKVDRVVELPVAKATSCAFGGPKLDQLFITTSRYGMSAADRAAAPLSGDLFVCRPGVSGLPTPAFAGALR